MKKCSVLCFCCLVTLFTVGTVEAQQNGFTVPGAGTNTRQAQHAQNVTVSQASTLAHKTPVILTGNIIQAIGHDYYRFRDSSGEIIVEINRDTWRGLSVDAFDIFQIGGNMEIKRAGRLVIKVEIIRKI